MMPAKPSFKGGEAGGRVARGIAVRDWVEGGAGVAMNPLTAWPLPVPDITSSVLARTCGGAPGGGPGRKTAPAGAACSRNAPSASSRRTGTRHARRGISSARAARHLPIPLVDQPALPLTRSDMATHLSHLGPPVSVQATDPYWRAAYPVPAGSGRARAPLLERRTPPRQLTPSANARTGPRLRRRRKPLPVPKPGDDGRRSPAPVRRSR